jgi:hypothetical protein
MAEVQAPVEIQVTDVDGLPTTSSVLQWLPGTLRTAVDELRHPETQAHYRKNKTWLMSTAERDPEFNPNSYCVVKLHLKELQNLVISNTHIAD